MEFGWVGNLHTFLSPTMEDRGAFFSGNEHACN